MNNRCVTLMMKLPLTIFAALSLSTVQSFAQLQLSDSFHIAVDTMVADRMVHGILRHESICSGVKIGSDSTLRFSTVVNLVAEGEYSDTARDTQIPAQLWPDSLLGTISVIPLAHVRKKIGYPTIEETQTVSLLALIWSGNEHDSRWGYVVLSQYDSSASWYLSGCGKSTIECVIGGPSLEGVDDFIRRQRTFYSMLVPYHDKSDVRFDQKEIDTVAFKKYFGGIPPSLQKYE